VAQKDGVVNKQQSKPKSWLMRQKVMGAIIHETQGFSEQMIATAYNVYCVVQYSKLVYQEALF